MPRGTQWHSAAKADQHGQQECCACMRVHITSDFFRWFFSVYKKCVRHEEIGNRFSRNWTHVHSKKVQMSTANHCSIFMFYKTKQHSHSSVKTDAIITHKQSAFFRTTEKSVDEQSWHNVGFLWWDRQFADQIFRPCSIERHAAAELTQRPHILAAWCDFCCMALPCCVAVCHAA